VFEGITAAGTVPDSHRIPLHRSGSCHPITIFAPQKYYFFPQPPTNPQKYSKIKKEKGTESYRKIFDFQCLDVSVILLGLSNNTSRVIMIR